jgi:regulator of sirC expression with transglutaminase-like and TPR domain
MALLAARGSPGGDTDAEPGATESGNLAETALLLGIAVSGVAEISGPQEHLATLASVVAPPDESTRDAEMIAALLRGTLAIGYGYNGDDQTYDRHDNALLQRVIARRRGLPVALSVLYLHTARAWGIEAHGIDFPGHFMIRIEAGGTRAIVDPFHGGARRTARDLRRLLKRVQGRDAELLGRHTRPVSDRSILLRLQNNLRKRRLAASDGDGALRVLQSMAALAPETGWIARATGQLHARMGRPILAQQALERALELAETPAEEGRVRALLDQLKRDHA